MEDIPVKKISTSALAKALALQAKELFQKMEKAGWIVRRSDNWQLTDKGREQGGEYQNHQKYGTYIVWPEMAWVASEVPVTTPSPENKMLTASAMGKKLDLSGQRINALLSELGWIQKALKGWHLTASGATVGGKQREDNRTGIPYVCWPPSILESKVFVQSLKENRGDLAQAMGLDQDKQSEADRFRDRFPAKLSTMDGHRVRSKAEMLIDNWLYLAEIVHAYERRLPIEEPMYSGFYIPAGKVYIEYWGQDNSSEFQSRKEEKLRIYQQYGLNLIQLEEADLKKLDEVLPRMLLKYGVIHT